MRQAIDFLPALDDPATRALPLRQALTLVALAAACLVAWGTFMELRLSSARATAQQLALQVDAMADELADRTSELVVRDPAPELVATLSALKREATEKARVLEVLGGESLGSTAGFSSHLDALSRRTPADIWLTRIVIGEGDNGLHIEGRARSASQVPGFLEALGASSAFSGQRFDGLRVLASQNGQGPAVSFTLSGACAPDDSGDGDACLARLPQESDQ